MSEFDLADLKKRMNGAVEVLRKEFAGLRTGRASMKRRNWDCLLARMPSIRSTVNGCHYMPQILS
jgi:hypothetical protein